MNLDHEIQLIHERNARVEADKAWETSWARLLVIGAITYAVAGVTLQLIGATRPWFTAFVPMLGWILSTQTLPPLKKWWIKRRR